jgi:hypothetical protein
MGRPVNKRYFGKGAGTQIQATFRVGGTEYNGYILSQRSTRKFNVTNDTVTAVCALVDKAPGELADNEMVIVVKLDDGTVGRATKIFNRTAIVNGQRVAWNFATSTSDDAGQIADVEAATLTPVITISSQPTDQSVTAPAAATFSVTASATPSADLTYQWQVQTLGAGAWSNVSGATAASLVIDPTDVAQSTNKYRVRISASGAKAVTSDAVTLTVAE